jgi:hypothetical protein
VVLKANLLNGPGSTGAYQAYGVVTFTMTAAGITSIISFGDPALVRAFGFPPVLPASELHRSMYQ